ncbi:hypothetical protein, partial [Microcoleus sp. herbarium12]|uniref:hypothetical protein n=1 Tax=Microcoleus sp. herbarium12 TaxID=3055437 RepID=UPI002FD72A16
MTADEAKEITEAIRGNFDSLGKMLVEVRERKGYSALGYKSLESYCLTEFGKGKSRVYQLIEEFKIEEQIIEELAASDSPITSLKMPGTLLRELRDLKSPRQKIEAIAYANQLAENDGSRRATKTHLQVAVHKISGGKSEQTRQIIAKDMGFDKGVEVEVVEGYNKCKRGVIRKIDTKGQVHVELYSGNSMPIAWDVSNLRIVTQAEKPEISATMDTIKIGDTVRIFSSNSNKLKIGTVVARTNNKQASVQIKQGHTIEIPYAELEKVTEDKVEQEVKNWEDDLIWSGSWNELSSWYYNAERKEIKSFPCPGMTFQIEENTKFSSPSEWLEKWKNKYGNSLVEAFITPDDITTLVIAKAIRMSDTEKQGFLARINVLITSPAILSPALEPEQTAEAEFLVE